MNELQLRIFHDRYAAKTPVVEGVTVFNRQKTGPHAQALGKVTATHDMTAHVEWQVARIGHRQGVADVPQRHPQRRRRLDGDPSPT